MGKPLEEQPLIKIEREVKWQWRNYIYIHNNRFPTAKELAEITRMPVPWIKAICRKVGYRLNYEK